MNKQIEELARDIVVYQCNGYIDTHITAEMSKARSALTAERRCEVNKMRVNKYGSINDRCVVDERDFPRVKYDGGKINPPCLDGFIMHYEPPIIAIQKDLLKRIEDGIYNAVLECEILVDKDELAKALHYDRDQYEKGFRDGLSATFRSATFGKDCAWISVDEWLPEPLTDVLVCDAEGTVSIDFVLKSSGEFVQKDVTHWMPLPEAPKM